MTTPSIVVAVSPELVRPDTARMMMGGAQVLSAMVRAKWLSPVHRGNRLTLYRVADLRLAAARLAVEALPMAQASSSMSTSEGRSLA